jgi:DNA-directed RNA polymerase subunit N (RpoN/RPB10)
MVMSRRQIDELLQLLRPGLREEAREVLARWGEPRYCGRAHLMGMRDRPGTRSTERAVFNQLLKELGADGFCRWYAKEFGVPVEAAIADNDGACK